jgi:hypothetical protein
MQATEGLRPAGPDRKRRDAKCAILGTSCVRIFEVPVPPTAAWAKADGGVNPPLQVRERAGRRRVGACGATVLRNAHGQNGPPTPNDGFGGASTDRGYPVENRKPNPEVSGRKTGSRARSLGGERCVRQNRRQVPTENVGMQNAQRRRYKMSGMRDSKIDRDGAQLGRAPHTRAQESQNPHAQNRRMGHPAKTEKYGKWPNFGRGCWLT